MANSVATLAGMIPLGPTPAMNSRSGHVNRSTPAVAISASERPKYEHDHEHDPDGAETECCDRLNVDQRGQRDEHEREDDDERRVLRELLDLLSVVDVEVPQ